MTRPYCVGLTGGIASGKSMVADLFAARGVPVVDTDRIAHQLTAPGGAALPPIVAVFGADALDASGALDRQAMRAKVFADPASRARLEAILHPLIRQQAQARVDQAIAPYVIVVVPLLVETGAYDSLCDRVLVVDCDPETQLARASARDQASREQVRAIMAAQASRETRRARADDLISNEGRVEALTEQVQRLHQRYLGLAAVK